MTLSPTDAPSDDRSRHGSADQSGEADNLVFVDATGRRALLLRRAGIVLGAAFLVYGVMVGVSFMGGPSLAPSEIAPFDSVSDTQNQDPATERVRKDNSPSARNSARPCRKQCRKICRKHPGKAACRKRLLGRTVNGPDGATPTRSAPASVR
ncbi:hypothetical protein G4Z16_23485 [Streptomyces bathyalis]|uniref:Uncharacterized protein n=1 Tax=Streptomyces bathyalis TaxID=2710756 RepID=A0A7T1T9L7_9ACTN|nr:hypothetical protein [Streptomyces bathyalis]QPP08880.1 hypothetical protein G4Z16_23485 [Streptomyces bathyalis]